MVLYCKDPLPKHHDDHNFDPHGGRCSETAASQVKRGACCALIDGDPRPSVLRPNTLIGAYPT